MKKIFFVFLIFTLTFIFVKSVKGQTSSGKAYITGCLRVKSIFPCYRSLQNRYSCLNENEIDFSVFGGKRDHIAKIEGEGFPVGKQIYIVGCISTTTGVKCTSGDAGINQRVRDMGFVVLDEIAGYEFKASQNPITTQDGKVSLLVRSATRTSENHLFYGLAEVTEEEYGGSARTVAYGTFGFSEDPEKCISIRWDPKGRVFDSESLEPLPEARVFLLDENKKEVDFIGLINPILTKEDGIFNFFLPAGTYYLKPEKDNYQFPLLNLGEVNHKYDRIYYCDLIVGQPLYFDQFPIIEENKLIHCDIPLKPLSSPFRGEVVIMDYGYMILGNNYKFFGRFSHPLTIVEIKQENKLLEKLTTDKEGGWEALIPSDKISSTGGEIEVLGIKNPSVFSSNNSTSKLNRRLNNNFFSYLINNIKSLLNKIFVKEIYSQSRSNKLILNPILRHIEGYAYNNQGNIIPKAIMNVVAQMDGKVYWQTQADEKGFFQIYSNQLPIFPYYLEIINPKSPNLRNIITTSQFIRFNKDYLINNKINLINATKNNQLISTTSSYFKKEITPFPTLSERDNLNLLIPTKIIKENNEINKQRNFLLTIGVILFFLISLVAGLILFYLKRKNNSFTS